MASGHTTNLYPSNTLNISSSFTLIDDLGLITIDGWGDGDCASVEVLINVECGEDKWIPFNPSCCGQLVYQHPQNQIYIFVPGTYRLVFSNKTNQHVINSDWFENMNVYGDKLSSNLELMTYLTGVSTMGCGPDIQVSCDPATGELTITHDDGICSVTPGSDVSIATLGNGDTLIIIDGEGTIIPAAPAFPTGVPQYGNDGTTILFYSLS